MKLRDLDACFMNNVSAGGSHFTRSDSVSGAQGVMFQCPSCAAGKEIVVDHEREGRRYVVGAHYIRVLFSNPVGAVVVPPEADHNPRWEMSGTTLDDLTLAPSINCDIPGPSGEPSVCKFHGYVKNGEAA